MMCSIEIPIKPKCFGLADNFGKIEMCDACKEQHDCSQVTMQRANKYALSFRYTTSGTCLYCGKRKTFCLVMEYGEINIKLCLPDVARMEHKAFEWKIAEDEDIWKPHKEWLAQ